MNIAFQVIIVTELVPCTFVAYFLNDPGVDIMINDFITLGHCNLPTPDYKLLPFRIASYFIQFLMFINDFTYFLIFTIYCDFSKRQLKSIHANILQTKTSNITIKQFSDSMLKNICKMYIEQKILYFVERDMLQKFVIIDLTILVPFLIICVYVCIRFSQLFFWHLYITSVLATATLASCLVFIHISGGCLHELSSKLLESVQKYIIHFTNRRPYWKTKFRSFREIRVGFLGYFSYTNLLLMCSYIVTATINLLLM